MSRFSNVFNRKPDDKHGKTPVIVAVLCGLYVSHALLAAETKPAAANLTAAQIAEKNVAARGGAQSWRAIQTMSVSGQMDAGSGDSVQRSTKMAREGLGASVKSRSPQAQPEPAAAAKQVQLPFVLEMKRPRMSRLEIQFAGKTAVQVYDGNNGWKFRPYLNRDDYEPFTEQEVKAAAGKGDMEGPLVDYAAKGTKLELAGVERVEGRNAYKLKLTLKNGDVQHIWIDSQSFLDVKIEGIPRRMDGRMRSVWIYQRDFRSVQGVTIPFLLETVVEGSRETHKTTIEKITLNEKLDDSTFAKPHA